MRLERIAAEEFVRLGGAPAAAARLRALVPDGASVAQEVAAIIAAVREQGEQAVLRYTREFDTAGAEPRPLRVPAEELDAAIQLLPLELVAGLQVAIVNVARVAEAGVGADTAVTLTQGHRVAVREIAVSSAAIYVPGGRAPYPSTVVMGVVTARSAGVLDVCVCAPPAPTRRSTPSSSAPAGCSASSVSTAWAARRRSRHSRTGRTPLTPSM